MTDTRDDPRLEEGIRLFNEQEYFACHDVFEDLWSELSGPRKTFYQGLIHAAVSLHHFEECNLAGARKMYGSFLRYTASFAPAFETIDVGSLLTDMEACFAELVAVKSGYPHEITLNRELLPEIRRRD